MRRISSNSFIVRFSAVYLMAAVFLLGAPFKVSAAVTVDIKANGADGTVTINNGDSYGYTWTSTGATTCDFTSPFPSSVTMSGSSTVNSGAPFYYPSVGSPVTITVSCSDGVETRSDSVVIQLAAAPAVTADLKANGSDGPVTINNGDSYGYTWTSTGATTCDFSSPFPSSVTLSGSSTVNSGAPFYYPSIGSPVTITMTCTNGTNSATDSVVINMAATSTAVTADIKANGSDGPVTITNGNSYTYNWVSANATTCDFTSPFPSSVTLSGNSTVNPGAPFYYPSTSTPVTITVRCTNGSSTATDSVVINLAGGTSSPVVTVDIKANGSDGPVTITNGSSYVYNWVSNNATTCDFTSPFPSSVTLSGNSTVNPGAPFYYPGTTTPVTITVTCTNGTSTATDSVVINLATTSSCPVLSITSSLSATGTISQPFSYTITATTTGVSATTTRYNLTGSLPAGLSFSSTTGVISGTPTVFGNFTVSIQALNDCGNDTETLTLTINNTGGPGCPTPVITSSLSENVFVGNPFNYTVGISGTASTTVSVSGLPAGLSYSSSTRTISGTPTTAGTYTIVITATNSCGTTVNNLMLVVNSPSGGGGGGGGGGSSSGGGSTTSGEVLGVSTATNFCPFLSSYMRFGQANDQLEVIKLQAFLKMFEGYDYVNVTGVFDEATHQAVSAFQLKYKDEILTPWGISAPTGYAYIKTIGKINQIVCGYGIPDVHPATAGKVLGKESAGFKEGMGTSSLNSIPVIGQNVSKGQNVQEDRTVQDPDGLAAALFSWPTSALETLQCLYELLLILIVLYILGNVLESVLYKDKPENVLKRFYTKWVTVMVGIVIAFFGAYMLKEWCLLLPLIVAFLALAVWVYTSPTHAALKKSVQVWYLGAARKGDTKETAILKTETK
jgi:hypothetical protein